MIIALCILLFAEGTLSAEGEQEERKQGEGLSGEVSSEGLWQRKSEAAFLQEQIAREKLAVEISDAFDGRSRRCDPFGFSGDMKDVSSSATSNLSERANAEDRFKEILHALKFTGVSPARRELFLESRVLRMGQCLVMRFQGMEVEARLMGVSVRQATFENPANGTHYVVPLHIAPETKAFGGNKYVH